MVELVAIYSPENFAMLLNCFDLISHFLSKMEMESKHTHARGVPYEGILHPRVLTVWEVLLHLPSPWFSGEGEEFLSPN